MSIAEELIKDIKQKIEDDHELYGCISVSEEISEYEEEILDYYYQIFELTGERPKVRGIKNLYGCDLIVTRKYP